MYISLQTIPLLIGKCLTHSISHTGTYPRTPVTHPSHRHTPTRAHTPSLTPAHPRALVTHPSHRHIPTRAHAPSLTPAHPRTPVTHPSHRHTHAPTLHTSHRNTSHVRVFFPQSVMLNSALASPFISVFPLFQLSSEIPKQVRDDNISPGTCHAELGSRISFLSPSQARFLRISPRNLSC